MYLTRNFLLSEAINSNVALENDIDNSIKNPMHINNCVLLAFNILEPIRKYFDTAFTPTSWYRCEALNKKVGGSSGSQHLYGKAADIVIPNVKAKELFKYICLNLPFDQVIYEELKSATWVHCSYNSDYNRSEMLYYDGNSYKNCNEDLVIT